MLDFQKYTSIVYSQIFTAGLLRKKEHDKQMAWTLLKADRRISSSESMSSRLLSISFLNGISLYVSFKRQCVNDFSSETNGEVN